MSDRKTRRARRTLRRIEASGRTPAIHADAVTLDWVEAAAADGGAATPKRFSMLAYTGGPMVVGYYGSPVVIDLAGLTAKAPTPILRDHDPGRVVGHADEVDVQAASLKLAGLVSGAGSDAAEIVASAGNGFPWQASVGVRPDKLEFVGEGIKTRVNGREFTGPLYVARKATLGEVSFVALGADGKATARVAASAALVKEDDMEFHAWIEAMGLTESELRDDQLAKLRAKYDAEQKAAEIKAAATGQPPVVQAPTFDLAAVVLGYETHAATIEATALEYADKVPPAEHAKLTAAARRAAVEAKATALREQWPAAKLEAEYVKAAALYKADLMVAARPAGPAIHSSSRDLSAPVLEAAFARTCGLRDVEKAYKPEILEAADRHYRNLGLQELLLICAQQAGYSGRMVVNDGNLRDVLKAAFSTHTVTTLLTTTGNKLLLEGFNQMPQSWRQVAGTRSVSDFKTVTAFRLTSSLEYVEVGAAGEITHGTLGQESYTMAAKTYARMAALTRQDIINDDLGAFDSLRSRLGMGAAIKLNKVFWTEWLSTSNAGTFWTSGRGNLQTGGATALAEAGLNTAVKLFRDATAPDGNMLGLEPKFLLVPSDLEATALKLYSSQELRDTTASTKTYTTNIYQNRFRPIVVPELSNSGYTGYSATAWWLLCDPSILASAVMCFLNGQQSPTVESTDADFNTLGIQFRGYHDFGVAMTEYRASVKSAGA